LAFSDYAQKDFDALPAPDVAKAGWQAEAIGPLQNGGTDAFAGIDGLFANIGFSGSGGFEVRFGTQRYDG
jgi:hypothetical protein